MIMVRSRGWLFFLWCWSDAVTAWLLPTPTVVWKQQSSLTRQFGSNEKQTEFGRDDDNDDDDDDDESTLDWQAFSKQDTETNRKSLGIHLGSRLNPLSPSEAADLTAAATEIVNDAIAAGIDDIERLRQTMKKEIDAHRRSANAASEFQAQQASKQLLSKIDALTERFLAQTDAERRSTKLVAAADQSAEGKGREFGVWGTINNAAVSVRNEVSSSSLGSVKLSDKSSIVDTVNSKNSNNNNRIIIVADTKQDPYAKVLVPEILQTLEIFANVKSTVYSPTSTIPLGGDNAQCAILFATSLTDASSFKKILDRMLRKTFQSGGAIGQPPSHIVLISTVGTERINALPYSMQNMLSLGKLDKRRQIEESLVQLVRNRLVDQQSVPLDYTICRLGEIKTTTEPFQLTAFDTLDGNTDLTTAGTVLKNAIALQPFARNATFSCVGKLPLVDADSTAVRDVLDEAFLRLDGPELLRIDLPEYSNSSSNNNNTVFDNYGSLVEYIRQWADLLAQSKRLTTPIRTQTSSASNTNSRVIARQDSTQLLFLPTATGRNYLSREEEKKLEKQSTKAKTKATSFRLAKEGGVEVVVELVNTSTTQQSDSSSGLHLRVRAKRCNYAYDAVIKELSEKTITSQLKDAIHVWENDHATLKYVTRK